MTAASGSSAAPSTAPPPPRAGRAGPHRWPLALRLGLGILALLLLAGIVGPWLIAYGPSQLGAGPPLAGASLEHPFGVDRLGRDVFARTLHGTLLVLGISLGGTLLGLAIGALWKGLAALLTALGDTLLGLAIGAPIGLWSGTAGGRIDAITMRLTEALIAVPALFLALLILALIDPALAGTTGLLIAVIAFLYAPRIARMARAVARDIAPLEFVQAARLRGAGPWRVALREVLPNCTGPLLVEVALRAAYAPVLVASLGFLGFGLKPPTPEWGLIIKENRELILLAPATVLGPGLTLALLVIGVNLVSDGLSRHLGTRHLLDRPPT